MNQQIYHPESSLTTPFVGIKLLKQMFEKNAKEFYSCLKIASTI